MSSECARIGELKCLIILITYSWVKFLLMSLENLKLLGLNIKEFLWDLVFLIVVGATSNIILHLLYFNSLHHYAIQFNLDFFPLSFEVFKIFAWIVSFLLLRWLWQGKIKTSIAMKFAEIYFFDSKNRKLTTEKYLKEWIFQGNSQPFKGGLLVTNSNSGCLIRPKGVLGTTRIWKNFEANIEIEFAAQNKGINPIPPHSHDGKLICISDECNYPFQDYLGIIFRAQSFDDYFMLEVTKINDYLIVRPHVRVGGNWDAPILNPDVNSLPLNSRAFSLNLKVHDDIATLFLNGNSINWLFPTHLERNLVQHGADEKAQKEILSKNLIAESFFKNRAGMFGFRCYGNQIALIKSLVITPIK